MLKNILESAGLNAKVCADLLGLDHKLFHKWLAGDRPIPGYIVPELSSVLGVSRDAVLGLSTSEGSVENAPGVWFKFRAGDRLIEADRELVLVVRRLGHYMDELEELSATRSVSWSLIFKEARKEFAKQASPVEQGRAAARYIRSVRGFGVPQRSLHGFTGAGDILRDNLRNMGVRIVETPLPKSNVEGCSFYVGAPGSEKPCLVANTYKQTWFRRNMVLAHELAHSLFDIETTAASVDFVDDSGKRQFEELRADAFAQELLVPKNVLHHIAQTNALKWDSLTDRDLALLVALTQVEQRAVIKAAADAGFINPDLADAYRALDIHQHLKALTERALSTHEFIEARHIAKGTIIAAEARTTTVPTRALRLPLPYVAKVVELAKSDDISRGKAAQLLMIDKDTFIERFGKILEQAAA
jgi:Zn-dependent peptidase ImmA (M78 family)